MPKGEFTGRRHTHSHHTVSATNRAQKAFLDHQLNVFHLDADSVWFANPYPLFKTLYKDYSLIIQTDNPWVNAGILYVQNVHDGDAAAHRRVEEAAGPRRVAAGDDAEPGLSAKS